MHLSSFQAAREMLWKRKIFLTMSGAIKGVDNIIYVRFAYGARGYKVVKRHNNNHKNGWIGEDLRNSAEESSVWNTFLSLHRVYPHVMIDLWSNIVARPVPTAFTERSRNARDLDSSIGYN